MLIPIKDRTKINDFPLVIKIKIVLVMLKIDRLTNHE